MPVQSVIFSREWFDVRAARAWLRSYGYRHNGKVHETANYHRFRQFEPHPLARYRTIATRTPGVKLVVEVGPTSRESELRDLAGE